MELEEQTYGAIRFNVVWLTRFLDHNNLVYFPLKRDMSNSQGVVIERDSVFLLLVASSESSIPGLYNFSLFKSSYIGLIALKTLGLKLYSRV